MNKAFLLLPIFAILLCVLIYNNASASTMLTGTATKCTGYYNCNFTVNNATGTGWVTTGPTYGTVSFQLPGEALPTYATYAFVGKSTLLGQTTYGATYEVKGNITATDANTGKLVVGKTDVIVGVKSKSGRGGGTTYTLVKGAIAMLETDVFPPPPPPFTAPQNVQATAQDDGIVLSWSPPASSGGLPVTGYNIYRSTSPGAETFYLVRGNVFSLVDTSVTSGITYYYKVSALNANGESPLSDETSNCLC